MREEVEEEEECGSRRGVVMLVGRGCSGGGKASGRGGDVCG